MVTKGRAQSKKTRESLQNLIDVKFKNFLKLKILKILNFKIHNVNFTLETEIVF